MLCAQVLAEKLPKGVTVSVGVSSLVIRLGNHTVAVQVLATTGDTDLCPPPSALASLIFPPHLHLTPPLPSPGA